GEGGREPRRQRRRTLARSGAVPAARSRTRAAIGHLASSLTRARQQKRRRLIALAFFDCRLRIEARYLRAAPLLNIASQRPHDASAREPPPSARRAASSARVAAVSARAAASCVFFRDSQPVPRVPRSTSTPMPANAFFMRITSLWTYVEVARTTCAGLSCC